MQVFTYKSNHSGFPVEGSYLKQPYIMVTAQPSDLWTFPMGYMPLGAWLRIAPIVEIITIL